ncbi:MAG: squalene/phytoene synthase family protein [Candidatus Symbiobacter sp.]|nr:squalene/phytoene synthase family protein [Candidatus Symbiobacter sp.]
MNSPVALPRQNRRENFLVASILLSPTMRPPILAFYHLARFGDDVADHPTLAAASKTQILAAMSLGLQGGELTAGDEIGRQAYDLGKNFARVSAEAGLPTTQAENMLVAFNRDVAGEIFADAGQLWDYCRYSAMTVGRYVLALHGYDPRGDAAAYDASDHLCAALQWFNHVQDCGQDFRQLARVYVPHSFLTAHQAEASDLAAARLTPQLRAALRDWLAEGEAFWQRGQALPQYCRSPRLRAEARAIVSLAAALSRRLRQSLETGDLLARRPQLYRRDTLRAMGAGFAAMGLNLGLNLMKSGKASARPQPPQILRQNGG